MNINIIAEKNLRKRLRENEYPGRGIVIGLDQSGKYLIQVYWIMGRSENSRNRLFVKEGPGNLYTRPLDLEKVKDPELIIYRAMAERSCIYMISNGHQTDTMENSIKNIKNIKGPGEFLYNDIEINPMLFSWKYEPDEPNFTPRISGFSNIWNANFYSQLSVLKKSEFSEACERHSYYYDRFANGFGYCITTYCRNGDPLPAFKGDPFLIPLVGQSAQEVAENFWPNLNEENRISLAVKFICIKKCSSEIFIINK